jgi:hypothetical protein
MKEQYEPSISEGYAPEDAGWTSSGQEPILLLSVPELEQIIGKSYRSFSYAWLYDKANDAYILCFQIDKNEEYAIFFAGTHAGQLLMEKEAYESFTIAITNLPFEGLTDESKYFMLHQIELERHPLASW